MSLKSELKLQCPMRPAGREPQSIKAIILNKSRTVYLTEYFNPSLAREQRQMAWDKGPRSSEGCRGRVSHKTSAKKSLCTKQFSPLPFLPLTALPAAVLSCTYPVFPHCSSLAKPPHVNTEPKMSPLLKLSRYLYLTSGSQTWLHIRII